MLLSSTSLLHARGLRMESHYSLFTDKFLSTTGSKMKTPPIGLLRTPQYFLILAALTMSAITAQSARAQSQGVDEDPSQWGLGLAAGQERKPYRGVDTKTNALPLVMYENNWLSIFGNRLDAKLWWVGPVSFALRARYADDGYDAGASSALAGMDTREGGVWVGGAAIWPIGGVTISAELLSDVSDISGGQQLKLAAARRFQALGLDFTPRLAVTRFDQRYVDYYYGVRAKEVRVNRAFYRGSEAVSVEVGLSVGFSLTQKQRLFLDVSATNLGNSIQESPIVEASGQTGVRFGYLYLL
jgi:outer membrane protein